MSAQHYHSNRKRPNYNSNNLLVKRQKNKPSSPVATNAKTKTTKLTHVAVQTYIMKHPQRYRSHLRFRTAPKHPRAPLSGNIVFHSAPITRPHPRPLALSCRPHSTTASNSHLPPSPPPPAPPPPPDLDQPQITHPQQYDSQHLLHHQPGYQKKGEKHDYRDTFPTPSTTILGGALKHRSLSTLTPIEWQRLNARGLSVNEPHITPTLCANGLIPFAAPFDYSHMMPHQIDPKIWSNYNRLVDYSPIPSHYGVGSVLVSRARIRAMELTRHMEAVSSKFLRIIFLLRRHIDTTTAEQRQELINLCASVDNILALTSISTGHFEPILSWSEARFESCQRDRVKALLEHNGVELYDSETFEPLSKLIPLRNGQHHSDPTDATSAFSDQTPSATPKHILRDTRDTPIDFQPFIGNKTSTTDLERLKPTDKLQTIREYGLVDGLIKHDLKSPNTFSFHQFITMSKYLPRLNEFVNKTYGPDILSSIGVTGHDTGPNTDDRESATFNGLPPTTVNVPLTKLSQIHELPHNLLVRFQRLHLKRKEHDNALCLLFYQVPPTSPFVLQEPTLRFKNEIDIGMHVETESESDNDRSDHGSRSSSGFDRFIADTILPELNTRLHHTGVEITEDFDLFTFMQDKPKATRGKAKSQQKQHNITESGLFQLQSPAPTQTPQPIDPLDPKYAYHTAQTTTGIISKYWTNDLAIIKSPSASLIIAMECLKDCLHRYLNWLVPENGVNDFPEKYHATLMADSSLPDLIQLKNSIMEAQKRAPDSDSLLITELNALPPRFLNTASSLDAKPVTYSTINPALVEYLGNYSEPPDVLPAQFIFLSLNAASPEYNPHSVRRDRKGKIEPNTIRRLSGKSTQNSIYQIAAVDGLGNEFSTFVQPTFPINKMRPSDFFDHIQQAWEPHSPSLSVAIDALMQWIYHPMSGRLPTTLIPNPAFVNPLKSLEIFPEIRSVVNGDTITDLELAALPPMVRGIFLDQLPVAGSHQRKTMTYDFLTGRLVANGLDITLNEKPSIDIKIIKDGMAQESVYLKISRDTIDEIHSKYGPIPRIQPQFQYTIPRASAGPILNHFSHISDQLKQQSSTTAQSKHRQRGRGYTRASFKSLPDDQESLHARIIPTDSEGTPIGSPILHDNYSGSQNNLPSTHPTLPSSPHLRSIYSGRLASLPQIPESDLVPSPLPPTMIISAQSNQIIALLDEHIRQMNYFDHGSNLLTPQDSPSFLDKTRSSFDRFLDLPKVHLDLSPQSYRHGFFHSGAQLYNVTESLRAFWPQNRLTANSLDIAYWQMNGKFQNLRSPDALFQSHRARSMFFMDGVHGSFMRAELHRAYDLTMQSGGYYLNPNISYPISTFHNIYQQQKKEFEENRLMKDGGGGDNHSCDGSNSCGKDSDLLFDFADYRTIQSFSQTQLSSIMGLDQSDRSSIDNNLTVTHPNSNKTTPIESLEDNSNSHADSQFKTLLKHAFPKIQFQPGNVVWDFSKNNYRLQEPFEAGKLTPNGLLPPILNNTLDNVGGFTNTIVPNIRGHPLDSNVRFDRQLTPNAVEILSGKSDHKDSSLQQQPQQPQQPLSVPSTPKESQPHAVDLNRDIATRWRQLIAQSRSGFVFGGGAKSYLSDSFTAHDQQNFYKSVSSSIDVVSPTSDGPGPDSNNLDDENDDGDKDENQSHSSSVIDGDDGDARGIDESQDTYRSLFNSNGPNGEKWANIGKEDGEYVTSLKYPHMTDKDWQTKSNPSSSSSSSTLPRLDSGDLLGKPSGLDPLDGSIFYPKQGEWFHQLLRSPDHHSIPSDQISQYYWGVSSK